MSTITAINELGEFHGWLGYEIILSDKKVICKIDNNANCCEVFGASLKLNETFIDTSNFELINQFIGAEVFDISYSKADIEDYNSISCTIITSYGQITIIIYNEHNGYYPHQYMISTGDEIIKGNL